MLISHPLAAHGEHANILEQRTTIAHDDDENFLNGSIRLEKMGIIEIG
jgi:hypothetical protein